MSGTAARGSLVLSLFPGIDGFGMGFEAEGYCVVAGPDLQWGRDIKSFHVPPGRFDGVTLDVSPDLALFEAAEIERTVIASGAKEGAVIRQDRGRRDRPARERQTLPGNLSRRSVGRCAELQGFDPAFLDGAPFTQKGKHRLIGNAVPLSMARAIARAVARAVGDAARVNDAGRALTPRDGGGEP